MVLSCLLVALQLLAAAPSVLVEIRIHGNHTTPDQVILDLAGLTIPQPFADDVLQQAEQRLTASGRFERVEVLQRFRSIDDPSQILVVILVDERPGASADGRLPGLVGRLLGQSMWAPILRFEDGYGFTYGGRASLVGVLGPGSRISLPLSWGGERQVALELERTVNTAVVSRVFGAVALRRRENPFFEIGDTRRSVSLGAERQLTSWLTAGATARLVNAAFDTLDESHRAVGARVTVDTRRDPAFPRNALLGQIGWERVGFDTDRRAVHRLTSDVRGYVGLIGPAVLVVSAAVDRGSGPLPRYEQRLLGGAATLRGYRAGALAGDSLAIASAELRLPITSPLSIGRIGVKAFTDVGAVWRSDERLLDQRRTLGIGGGAFLTLTAFTAGVDVAWAESGRARAHVTLGVTF